MTPEKWRETAHYLSTFPTACRVLLVVHQDAGNGLCAACERHGMHNAPAPCSLRQLAELATNMASLPCVTRRGA